jgi:hypothetical protein
MTTTNPRPTTPSDAAGHRFPVAGPTSRPAAPKVRRLPAAGPAVPPRPAVTQPWIEPSLRALSRGQPPPAGSKARLRREGRFWGYLLLAVVLATLVLVIAGVAAGVADSTGFRLLVAFAIPVVAGLAVAASGKSTDAAAAAPRGHRRPHS